MLSKIGQQLLFYRPFVYHWTEPNQQWMVPSLSAVARGDHITQPPWFHQTTIVSSNQMEFISFAKTSQFGKGIWLVILLTISHLVELEHGDWLDKDSIHGQLDFTR